MSGRVPMRRVPGVRQTILIIAMVIAQFGRAADKKSKIVPNITKAKAAIEKEIRKRANKPTGELTKADLEKVTKPVLEVTDVRVIAKLTQLEILSLFGNQFTDVSGLAGLTKLKFLNLRSNQLTDTSTLVELTKVEGRCRSRVWRCPPSGSLVRVHQVFRKLQGGQ